MLQLPDVTLVCIETRQHTLACMAIEDCLAKVAFGDVLVFSDKQMNVPTIYVEDWADKLGWSRFYWSGVVPYLKTSHTLACQWDSWICDVSAWQEEFLQYDYIGAPWWYIDGRNVGNGGFSLRSTALCRYLRTHRDTFPCNTAVDDDLLCRRYRPRLEEAGFVWAPEPVAQRFAFECTKPSHPTFGFHAFYNFGYVLDKERLLERVLLAQQSPYIRGSWMWEQLMKRNPGLLLDFSED